MLSPNLHLVLIRREEVLEWADLPEVPLLLEGLGEAAFHPFNWFFTNL